MPCSSIDHLLTKTFLQQSVVTAFSESRSHACDRSRSASSVWISRSGNPPSLRPDWSAAAPCRGRLRREHSVTLYMAAALSSLNCYPAFHAFPGATYNNPEEIVACPHIPRYGYVSCDTRPQPLPADHQPPSLGTQPLALGAFMREPHQERATALPDSSGP